MPTNGKKSITVYDTTVKTLGEAKAYGETWDEFLLNLLLKSGRIKHISQDRDRRKQEGAKNV